MAGGKAGAGAVRREYRGKGQLGRELGQARRERERREAAEVLEGTLVGQAATRAMRAAANRR